LTDQNSEKNQEQEVILTCEEQISLDLQTLAEHLSEFKKRHPEQFFGTPEWELMIRLEAAGLIR
jgi:hypothetical protein